MYVQVAGVRVRCCSTGTCATPYPWWQYWWYDAVLQTSFFLNLVLWSICKLVHHTSSFTLECWIWSLDLTVCTALPFSFHFQGSFCPCPRIILCSYPWINAVAIFRLKHFPNTTLSPWPSLECLAHQLENDLLPCFVSSPTQHIDSQNDPAITDSHWLRVQVQWCVKGLIATESIGNHKGKQYQYKYAAIYRTETHPSCLPCVAAVPLRVVPHPQSVLSPQVLQKRLRNHSKLQSRRPLLLFHVLSRRLAPMVLSVCQATLKTQVCHKYPSYLCYAYIYGLENDVASQTSRPPSAMDIEEGDEEVEEQVSEETDEQELSMWYLTALKGAFKLPTHCYI